MLITCDIDTPHEMIYTSYLVATGRQNHAVR
jgi:hypothetical protein